MKITTTAKRFYGDLYMKARMVIIVLIVFSFFFLFYFSKILPSVFGADSGELLAAMKVLGVAHPPGYPLYTIIGNWLLKLPFGEPAFRVGIFSSFTSAATLVLLFLSCYFVTNSIIISLFSMFILAFSYTFWLYSEVVEVFSLNTLFATILLFCSVLILNEKKINSSIFSFFAFIFGLSLAHHHTILLLFPAFIYLFSLKKKLLTTSLIFKCFLFFILGLLPYLYLPWAARNLPVVNWGNPSTLNNFLAVILRSQYGTFQSMLGNFPNLTERILQIPFYGLFVLMDFSPIIFIFLILGMLFLYKNKKGLLFFLILAIFFSGPLFFFYASFPLIQNFIVGILERFFLLSTPFLILLCACGIEQSRILLSKIFTHLRRRIVFDLFIYLFLLIYISILFQQNVNRLDFRNVYIGNAFAYDILRPAEKNAIVFLQGDMAFFSAQYVYYLLGYRNDIKLIPITSSRDFYKSIKFHKLYSDLILPDKLDPKTDLNTEIIKLNKDSFPIYSINSLTNDRWVNIGYLYKYIPSDESFNKEILKEQIISSLDNFMKPETIPPRIKQTIFFSEITEYYYLMYLNNSGSLMDLGYPDEAIKYIDYVYANKPASHHTISSIEKLYTIYYFKKGDCEEAEEHGLLYLALYQDQPAGSVHPYLYLESIAKDCFHDTEKEKKYNQLYSSVLKENNTPLNKL